MLALMAGLMEIAMRILPLAFACLALALADTASAQDGRPDRRSCAQATRPVAQALAERAAQHLAKLGPEQAFKDFQNPAGGFLDGDLYVFVFDFEGVLRASGGFPRAVGRNLIFHHEPAPTNTRGIIKVAREQGKGWFEYVWVNPCSGKRETKISYVIKVGDLIVGVGAYLREGV
jgi:cytochrome c